MALFLCLSLRKMISILHLKEKWFEFEHKPIYTLFFVLTFLFYGNSLKNKYSLDDEYITITNFPVKGQSYIPNNTFIKDGFKSIPKIWTSRYAHDSEFSFDYRPVVTTTFAIEYGIFGQNPFVSHLINVLLYFILICLLFKTLLAIFKDHKQKFILAFLSALLFLIHPLHTEVVASLKCRDELLACIFSLLALKNILLFIEKPSITKICLIVIFLFLGYFSKLSAVLVMFSIPLIILFYRKVGVKNLGFIILGVYILYMAFQGFANYMPTEENIRHFYHFENPLSTDYFSFYQKIMIGIKTFGFYIQMLFFPYPLRFYYGANMFDLSSNINSYSIITLVFIILCSLYYFKKRDKDFLFSFLWLVLLMFPFLNIMTPVAGILGDRLMFIPSIAFCLLITNLLKPLFSSYIYTRFTSLFKKPMAYVMPVIFICMIYVIKRNSNWYNKLTLFEHDISHLEKSAKANSLLGNEYFEMLRSPNKKYSNQVLIQKCLKHYSAAVTNDSSFFTAYNNVGVVYFNYLNDIPNAKKQFLLGIRYRPNYAQAFENLGNCYKKENNITKAFESYKSAIIIKPKELPKYLACINLFFETKEFNKCIKVIYIAQSVFPNNYELIAQEANCLFMQEKYKAAFQKYDKAYSILPNTSLAKYISVHALKHGDTTLFNKYRSL